MHVQPLDAHRPNVFPNGTSEAPSSRPVGAASGGTYPQDQLAHAQTQRVYSRLAVGVATSAATAALSAVALAPTAALVAPLVGCVGLIAGVMGIAAAGGGKNPVAQHASWLGMHVGAGLIAGAYACLGSTVVVPALVATAATTAGIMALTHLLPAGSLASWRGPLLGATAGLCVVGLIGCLAPAGWALTQFCCNAEVVLGLGIFSATLAADTDGMRERAQRPGFDPLQESAQLYLNVFNLLQRFLVLEAERRRR
jgi:FtsH-binding integral membrane protein